MLQGALYIWVIYSLVCCWLELQAGPGASSPWAPTFASSWLSLARGAAPAPPGTGLGSCGSSSGSFLTAEQQHCHCLPCGVQHPVGFGAGEPELTGPGVQGIVTRGEHRSSVLSQPWPRALHGDTAVAT